jgi:dephospho-CoA kinase
MLRVGLTGGLASGKSTVAAFFRELGAFHVDADRIAHELLAPGGGAEREVVARFGGGIVGPSGSIDRKALGAIVFSDPRALRDLNALVHPRVRTEISRQIEAAASAATPARVALVDAALLVESGIHRDLDALVVVSCREATQIARATARGGLTEAEARARIAAQAPLADKLAAADHVIDNDGALDETKRQVRRVWDELLADPRAGGP